MEKIAILGAGNVGCSLAGVLGLKGHQEIYLNFTNLMKILS